MDEKEESANAQQVKNESVSTAVSLSVCSCPDCGSEDYVGNFFGGCCSDCGYRWGWCM